MKKIIFLLYFILGVTVFSVNLTKEEKKWIESKKGTTIEINFNENLQDDIFLFRDGNIVKGVDRNLFCWIKEKTGIDFNVVSTNQIKLNKNLTDKSNERVYLRIQKNPEREKQYNYLDMFSSYNVVLIDNKKIDSSIEKNLKGKRIGVIIGNSEAREFKKAYQEDGHIIVPLKNIGEGFKKMESEEIDYVLGKTDHLRAVNYHFHELQKIKRVYYNMAVAKEFPEFYSVLKKYHEEFRKDRLEESIKRNKVDFYKGMIKNDPDYLKVKEKYTSLKILLQEEKYLLPLYYEKAGKFEGYIPDHYKTIGEILELPIEFIRVTDGGNIPEFHIRAISSMESPEFQQLYPYYTVRNIIMGRADGDYLIDFSDFEKYKVGAKDIQIIPQILREKTINIHSYDTAIDGLLRGEIDYLIGDFRILSEIVRNRYLRTQLNIVGDIPGNYEIYPEISLEHRELIRIMEKISKPYVGEGYILRKSINKPIVLNPNYKKVGVILFSFLSVMGIFLYLLRKFKREAEHRERMMNSLIESFEMANHFSDEDTGMHIIRINKYATFMAEKLGAERKFVKEMGKYSSLHDVGKIGIADSILKKPGKLTMEEWNEMEKHVEIGFELVKKMNVGTIAENIVRYHHERWDGKGYIEKLKGEEIPLESRIVSLVDVYDALRQKRVYKEGFTHEEAVNIIQEESGKAFDPILVDIFLKNHTIFNKIFSEGQEQ